MNALGQNSEAWPRLKNVTSEKKRRAGRKDERRSERLAPKGNVVV